MSSPRVYQDKFLTETGSLINYLIGKIFPRNPTDTKLNYNINVLSTYPGKCNWQTKNLKAFILNINEYNNFKIDT